MVFHRSTGHAPDVYHFGRRDRAAIRTYRIVDGRTNRMVDGRSTGHAPDVYRFGRRDRAAIRTYRVVDGRTNRMVDGRSTGHAPDVHRFGRRDRAAIRETRETPLEASKIAPLDRLVEGLMHGGRPSAFFGYQPTAGGGLFRGGRTVLGGCDNQSCTRRIYHETLQFPTLAPSCAKMLT